LYHEEVVLVPFVAEFRITQQRALVAVLLLLLERMFGYIRELIVTQGGEYLAQITQTNDTRGLLVHAGAIVEKYAGAAIVVVAYILARYCW
jgi:hypothetical protein